MQKQACSSSISPHFSIDEAISAIWQVMVSSNTRMSRPVAVRSFSWLIHCNETPDSVLMENMIKNYKLP